MKLDFIQKMSKPLIRKVLHSFSFINGLKSLSMVFALSAAIWAVEGLVFWIGLIAFHFPYYFIFSYFTLALVNIGLIVPSTSGGIVLFQGPTVFAFSFLNLPAVKNIDLFHCCSCSNDPTDRLISIFILNDHGFSISKIETTPSPSI